MPIVIKSVGDEGQRGERGFEWPDDSALKRVEKEGGGRLEYRARRPKSKLKARPTTSSLGCAGPLRGVAGAETAMRTGKGRAALLLC